MLSNLNHPASPGYDMIDHFLEHFRFLRTVTGPWCVKVSPSPLSET